MKREIGIWKMLLILVAGFLINPFTLIVGLIIYETGREQKERMIGKIWVIESAVWCLLVAGYTIIDTLNG